MRLTARWFAALFFLVSFQLAHAQVPSGTLDFEIDNTTPIIDLNGGVNITGEVNAPDGSTFDVSIGVALTTNGRGFVSGSGLSVVQIGDDLVAGEYKVKGKLSRSDGETRGVIAITVKGSGVVAGRDTGYKLTMLFDGTIDATTGEWTGTVKTSIAFSSDLGKGRGTSEDFTTFLPGDMDGSWTLTLNILPLKPAGTAVITLSNGRVINFNLTGKFKEGTTSFKGTGVGDDKGSNLKIGILGEDELDSLSGTVLGQKIELFSAPPPPPPDDELSSTGSSGFVLTTGSSTTLSGSVGALVIKKLLIEDPAAEAARK